MRPTWREYVRNVAGDDNGAEIARRTGIDQTTISRWLSGKIIAISSSSVATFARAYDRPVLEAFVIAGFLTPAEAGVTFISHEDDLSGIDSERLLDELSKRLDHTD